ncbi:hypothetical protein AVEN_169161-1 [Araneus ventricosus]|uniref:Uncharacterized protein n=1 Tax=Araneus ventricosus TaxID=182803 RepID=A0A4Y2QZP1_ARAVE|nr:hypothetical protein AVEN_251272-1 [Araneus ventricosus]GBN68619.1 hypothetical protein AVEN_169161-1 [Araneus ventricosus]
MFVSLTFIARSWDVNSGFHCASSLPNRSIASVRNFSTTGEIICEYSSAPDNYLSLVIVLMLDFLQILLQILGCPVALILSVKMDIHDYSTPRKFGRTSPKPVVDAKIL